MTMKFNEEFGQLLKKARESHGISQSELARKLGYSSPQYISNYERGLCMPPMKNIKKIIREIDLDPQRIFLILKEYQEGELRKLIF